MQLIKLASFALVATLASGVPIPGCTEQGSQIQMVARGVGSQVVGIDYDYVKKRQPQTDWGKIIEGPPLFAKVNPNAKASAANRGANALVKGVFKVVNGVKKLFRS